MKDDEASRKWWDRHGWIRIPGRVRLSWWWSGVLYGALLAVVATTDLPGLLDVGMIITALMSLFAADWGSRLPPVPKTANMPVDWGRSATVQDLGEGLRDGATYATCILNDDIKGSGLILKDLDERWNGHYFVSLSLANMLVDVIRQTVGPEEGEQYLQDIALEGAARALGITPENGDDDA